MQAVSDVNRWDLLQRGQEDLAGNSKDGDRG